MNISKAIIDLFFVNLIWHGHLLPNLPSLADEWYSWSSRLSNKTTILLAWDVGMLSTDRATNAWVNYQLYPSQQNQVHWQAPAYSSEPREWSWQASAGDVAVYSVSSGGYNICFCCDYETRAFSFAVPCITEIMILTDTVCIHTYIQYTNIACIDHTPWQNGWFFEFWGT